MEEEGSHTEQNSQTGSMSGLPQQQQQEQPDSQDLLISSRGSAPSSPTPTGTLSRLGFKSPTSPTAAVPGSPQGQVSAITVVALLDKLVSMLEVVQDNQKRMEERQADLEGAVRVMQGDMTRLSKTHLTTSNSVSKLLERSRKVNGNIKEVKERLDKQAVQVKRLEANHSHLLKRNHFKVLIFQEDNEIPSSVFVQESLKTPQPSQVDAESTHPTPSVTSSVDPIHYQEEGLQTVNLSSDEDDNATAHHEHDDLLEGEGSVASAPIRYERRADKFKRNSLKKVDSLKKTLEKTMNQLGTKIVPPERREKIKKTLTHNHPKSPTAKSSSFKVSPMTFNVRKVRDGEAPPQVKPSSEIDAHVEILPLGNIDGEINLADVHSPEGLVEEVQEMLNSTTTESMKAQLGINGETTGIECEINGKRAASLAVPERDEDIAEDEEEKGGSPS
ncbi:caveolae-associated protein 2a isoform X2 [Thalassophryne amazonica]|uniref:caveolae-associated protein 2a isoform X2 n=1 Tax=Thalassophryne amazonica TaxID=390379 RepID=UPI0014720D54|nr:caveolae-associated protein 2a isoform X2 [Thalassophryne amazonica]